MDAHADALCDECKRRSEVNPLRAFDCKNPECAAVMDGAPKISDYLCDDCREHYEAVKKLVGIAHIPFVEEPRLVRGLDYYTRTVFEVQVVEGMGSQNAIGGGGRYDTSSPRRWAAARRPDSDSRWGTSAAFWRCRRRASSCRASLRATSSWRASTTRCASWASASSRQRATWG